MTVVPDIPGEPVPSWQSMLLPSCPFNAASVLPLCHLLTTHVDAAGLVGEVVRAVAKRLAVIGPEMATAGPTSPGRLRVRAR